MTYCDDCIHYDVCGEEDARDEAITYCAYKKTESKTETVTEFAVKGMTREEIKNTPELVDFMLNESIIADSRKKLRKRMDEICNLAIKALEQEPKTGHWILKRTFPTKLYDEYLNEYKCSECYREIRCAESQLVNYPYCHCGAKME